jgi:hypothetical protein
MSSATYGRHRDRIGATVPSIPELENDPDNTHTDVPILENTHVHTVISSDQAPQIETAPPMKAKYGTGGESGGL